MAETLASVSEKKSAAPQVNSWRRFIVLLEVVTVTLLFFAVLAGFSHLVRVFVSPGMLRWTLLLWGAWVVIFVPICLVLFLTKKASKSYGVSVSDWSQGLKIGALVSTLAAVEITLMIVLLRNESFSGWDARGNLISVCIVLPHLVLFGWILNFFQSVAKRLPTFVAILALIGVWAMPLVLVHHFDKPLGPALIMFVYLVLFVGFGEEIIFRGYIQSRLNGVFGQPLSFYGIKLGWGLFIASFLFGFVHLFNGFDFIQGHYNLQWSWGIGSFVMGLVFGCIREKTGSILSGALLHGTNDFWIIIIQSLR